MGPIRLAALLLPLAVVFLPAGAQAQRRPIYPIYPGYPGYPGGYPSYRYVGPESDLRFNVKPKDAAVYVDGYFAGRVEEFDGAFERLHVAPGQHEIIVYLEGYRRLSQRLYLSPNTTRKIQGDLERLASGEALEPAPHPVEPPPGTEASPPPQGRPMPRAGLPDPRDRDPRDPRDPGDPRNRVPRDGDPRDRDPRDRDPRDRENTPDSRTGTLAIRVQPGGATVLIDGERWQGPSGNDDRLIVQVPEGRHTVEVQREGFESFVTEIDVRRGQTAPVNVSLTRAR